MIREFDTVALTRDFEAYGLKRGDIGTVVHTYSEGGFEVEFATGEGKTVAVLTVKIDDVRSLYEKEILHVREISWAANA
jgi:hypothetical protein